MSFLDNYACPWNNSDHLLAPVFCSCSEFLWDPPSASMTCLVSPLTLFLNMCVISVWLLWLYKFLVNHVCQLLGFEKNTAFQAALISPGPYSARTSKAELIIFSAPTCSFFWIPWWVIVYIFCLFVYWRGSAFLNSIKQSVTLRLETPLWSFTGNSLCWPHFAFQPPSKI